MRPLRHNQPGVPQYDPTQGIEVSQLWAASDVEGILKGVDFKIEPGTHAKLYGQSGSGKSTVGYYLIGHPIGRKEKPDQGTVKIGDTDIYELPKEARRAYLAPVVGYAPQRPQLTKQRTVAENIRFQSRMKGLELDTDLVIKASRIMGIENLYGRKIPTLSGGQQQRVGLLTAIAHNPDIIILDEATANLDHALKAETGQMIADLAGNLGKTVIEITHEPEYSLAPLQLSMEAGRIVVEQI